MQAPHEPHRQQSSPKGFSMNKLTTAFGAPVVDNQNTQTAGPRGPALLQDVWLLETCALPPGGHPRTPHARKGCRRVWDVHGHARYYEVHKGKHIFDDRQEDLHVRAVLDGRWRARRSGRRTGYSRFCTEVLYRGRKLGSGGQQHTGFLSARCPEVSGPEPRYQTGSSHRPKTRREQLGFFYATA